MSEKIIYEKYLERIVSKKIFEYLFGKSNTNKDKIYYIFKKQMLILFFPDYYIIKIIISDLSPYNNKNRVW